MTDELTDLVCESVKEEATAGDSLGFALLLITID